MKPATATPYIEKQIDKTDDKNILTIYKKIQSIENKIVIL